jgi:hypothetical protein
MQADELPTCFLFSGILETRLVDRLQDLAILQEITGWQRNRKYRYGAYLKLFEMLGAMPADADEAEVVATQSAQAVD